MINIEQTWFPHKSPKVT